MIEIRRTVPVTFRREQLLRFIRHLLEMAVLNCTPWRWPLT